MLDTIIDSSTSVSAENSLLVRISSHHFGEFDLQAIINLASNFNCHIRSGDEMCLGMQREWVEVFGFTSEQIRRQFEEIIVGQVTPNAWVTPF